MCRDVVALTAGLAGLDEPKDLEWAAQLTALDGLNCSPVHVNDSVVAYAGALLSQPGIIVVCGTGSILYAVNEAGQSQRNYDFHHYANTAARALALDAVHRLLAGEAQEADTAFVLAVVEFWQAEDLSGLRNRVLALNGVERMQIVHAFGSMAFLVTRFAAQNAPLPLRVCQSAAQAVRIGICMLGEEFTTPPISVALIGSAARSPAMQQALDAELSRFAPGKYRIVEPALSSVAGAILMALRDAGIAPDDALTARLRSHPQATFPLQQE